MRGGVSDVTCVVGAGPAGAAAALGRAAGRGAGCCCWTGPTSPGTRRAATASPPHALDVLAGLGVTGAVDGYSAGARAAPGRPRRRRGGPGAAPAGVHRAAAGVRRPAGGGGGGGRCRAAPAHGPPGASRGTTGWCWTASSRRGWWSARTAPARWCGGRSATRSTRTGTWPSPSAATRRAAGPPEQLIVTTARAGPRTPGRSRSATARRTSGTARCCAASR